MNQIELQNNKSNEISQPNLKNRNLKRKKKHEKTTINENDKEAGMSRYPEKSIQDRGRSSDISKEYGKINKRRPLRNRKSFVEDKKASLKQLVLRELPNRKSSDALDVPDLKPKVFWYNGEREGQGVKLGDIPRIKSQIEKTKSLRTLYRVLFYQVPSNRKDMIEEILQFNGFPFDKSSFEYSKRLRILKTLYENVIYNFCELLDVEKGKDKLSSIMNVLEFLQKPYLKMDPTADPYWQPVVQLEKINFGYNISEPLSNRQRNRHFSSSSIVKEKEIKDSFISPIRSTQSSCLRRTELLRAPNSEKKNKSKYIKPNKDTPKESNRSGRKPIVKSVLKENTPTVKNSKGNTASELKKASLRHVSNVPNKIKKEFKKRQNKISTSSKNLQEKNDASISEYIEDSDDEYQIEMTYKGPDIEGNTVAKTIAMTQEKSKMLTTTKPESSYEVVYEQFGRNLQELSSSLRKMIQRLQETTFPNDVQSTLSLLQNQRCEYHNLKEDIRYTAMHGEILLNCIQKPTSQSIAYPKWSDRFTDVASVQRLLLQIDETERSFDSIWSQHEKQLSRCLELRKFEQEFKELEFLTAENEDLRKQMKHQEAKYSLMQREWEQEREAETRQLGDKIELFQRANSQLKKSKKSTATINSLNDDCLIEIFSLLSFAERLKIQRVSLRWYNLLNSEVFCRNINLDEFSIEHRIKIIASLPPSVSSLKFCACKFHHDGRYRRYPPSIPVSLPEFLFKLCERCTCLETLYLRNVALFNAHDWTYFWKNSELCKEEDWDSCRVFENEPCVEETTASQFFKEDDIRTQHTLLPSLKKLYLIHVRFHSFEFFSRISSAFPQIRVLNLTFSKPSSMKGIDHLFSTFINLEELSLAGWCLEDPNIFNFLSHARKLRLLDLQCARISDSTISVIKEKGILLKELCLSCTHIGDSLCRYENETAEFFPQLKVLCLERTNVTPDGIVSLLNECPSLEYINVKKCENLSSGWYDSEVLERFRKKVHFIQYHSFDFYKFYDGYYHTEEKKHCDRHDLKFCFSGNFANCN